MNINTVRSVINKLIKEDYRFEYKQNYKTPPHVSDTSKKAKEEINKNNLIKKYKEQSDKKIVTGERRALKLIEGEHLNYNEIRALRDLFVNLEQEYKNEKSKGKTIKNSAVIQIWELNGGVAAKNWAEGILSRHHGKSMKHKELRRGTGDRNRIGNTKNLMKARLSRKPSISENASKKGGVLFILGQPLENGKRRLYVTHINNLTNLDRLKKDNSPGEPVKMVSFGNNEVLTVVRMNGKLKAVKTDWTSRDGMLKRMGLTNTSVGLNPNKTPYHIESLKFNSISDALNELESTFEQEKKIDFPLFYR
jgi:hypothetical protein